MSKKKVLIIDDVKTSRLSAQIYLEQLKFSPIGAENIAQATSILETDKIDVVLLDWYLGEESGLEFCRTLRSKYGSTLKIIMMSGVEDGASSANEAIKSGADAFVQKPTTIGTIIEGLIGADIDFTSNTDDD